MARPGGTSPQYEEITRENLVVRVTADRDNGRWNLPTRVREGKEEKMEDEAHGDIWPR